MVRKAASEGVSVAWPACAVSSARRAARLLTQLYDSYLADYGIEITQFALLRMIDASPDKGQAAIAQSLGMDKTTLSRNLKVVREKGWVASEVGDDARSRQLSLTPEGRAMLLRGRPAWKAAQEALHREMGREWDALSSGLDNLSRAATSAIESRESENS
ncbi:MAG TPA: MarR family winged helix-turn-helix transcriptional regulator [Edaphobacter sp.]